MLKNRNLLKQFVFTLFFIFLVIPSFADTYQTKITKITDGDTVWIQVNHKYIKLRLLGIDTPEEYPSRKMSKDMRMCHTSYKNMRYLGLLATKHAETMLYKGENVIIKTFGKGYYHRTLAYIILPDGTNYNEREVADGYACVYKYRGHKSRELPLKEYRKLLRLMDQAKRNKRGLWRQYSEIMECLCK